MENQINDLEIVSYMEVLKFKKQLHLTCFYSLIPFLTRN